MGPLMERETLAPQPRLLCVGESSELIQDITRYAEAVNEGLMRVADAPAALRALGRGGWALVLVALDEEPDEHLRWWVDVLHRVPRRPRLVVLVPSPTIGFTLRAWQLGVFEVLPIPLTRERFAEVLARVISAEDETPIELPASDGSIVGSSRMISARRQCCPCSVRWRRWHRVRPRC